LSREAILSLQRVSVTYRSGPVWNRRVVQAVRGVEIEIEHGTILGLVGESGSGKTTMGRLCLGLLRPTEGRVLFERAPMPKPRAIRGRAAVVLQQPEWALNPRLRVGTSVAEPLTIQGVPKLERTEQAADALRQVGLDPTLTTRYPHELSGGQRQRAAIARALITNPSFVVFDEAVSALDVSVQTQVLNLIRSLQETRSFSALFISHDLAATRYVADRIAVMRDGEIVETGSSDDFYAPPQHPYSRELWSTVMPAEAVFEDGPPAGPEVIPMSDQPTPPGRSRSVAYDMPEMRIGIAEYDHGPTGCTVLHFPERAAACATDIRGGAPGVIGGFARTDAVCFAGGSLYGLEASFGVSAELLARRGTAAWGQIALVSGAIIYDFRPRDNIVYPDRELGRRALLAAGVGVCPVGPRGAGRLATVGKLSQAPNIHDEPGGQGAAFREVDGTGVRVFVLSVVNAIGVIVDRSGRIVRGCYDPDAGIRHHPRDLLMSGTAADPASTASQPTQNTTVTAVVTNKRMPQLALTQMARQVHASMARAIQPFHTLRDGDVLFALSTETVEEAALEDLALAEIASDLAWDAVLNAVEGN